MKRKLTSIILAIVLCLSFSYTAFAAETEGFSTNSSTSPVEIMHLNYEMNSVGGITTTVYVRNNSSKTIKYIDFYMVGYNPVGDRVSCDIRRDSVFHCRGVGPIEPFNFSIDTDKVNELYASTESGADPFSASFPTYCAVNDGSRISSVRVDRWGNLYAYKSSGSGYVYLSAYEIAYGLFDPDCCYEFENVWYNKTTVDFDVTKMYITYMDGTTQTLQGDAVYSPTMNTNLYGDAYNNYIKSFAAFYNPEDYMKYNPDLVSAFGDNRWRLLLHFASNGIKEGRRASDDFDLATYKQNNPDLVEIFGDNNREYYVHFGEYGKAEGRIAA